MYAPSLIVQTMGATQGTNYSSWSREEVLPHPPKVTGGRGGGTGGGNGNGNLTLAALKTVQAQCGQCHMAHRGGGRGAFVIK